MKKKIIDNFNNFQAKTTPNPLKIVVKNATGSYITDFDNKKYKSKAKLMRLPKKVQKGPPAPMPLFSIPKGQKSPTRGPILGPPG